MPVPYPNLRDVWVSRAVRHVPAHRIPRHAVPLTAETRSVWQLSCPPFVASGGEVLTREDAAGLEAFACLRCFPPAPQPPPAATPEPGTHR